MTTKIQNAEDKGIHLSIASLGLVELSGDASENIMLRKVFGDKLPATLAIDPEPMLLMANDLLDKGDVRNGAQTWVFGYYGYWITSKQFSDLMTPMLLGAPVYPGHQSGREYALHLGTVVWAGMDDRTQTPSAIIYIEPTAVDLRKSVKLAVIQGNLRKKFHLSLGILEKDADFSTMQITGFPKPDETSLDFVRFGGTKGAGISSAITLNGEEGDSIMALSFKDMDECLAHKDVQAAIETRAKELVKLPATVKEIMLSIPVETLRLERTDLKPYFDREDRATVLKSVKEEELGMVLSSQDLRTAAMKTMQEAADKIAKFRPEAEKCLIELGMDPAKAKDLTLLQDLSHCDIELVKAAGKQYLHSLDPDSAGNRKGVTELSAEADKTLPGVAKKGSEAPALTPSLEDIRAAARAR